MIFSQSCVQFGGGRMGGVWVRSLAEYFESVALVDPDPERARAVEDTHAHYFNMDILDDDEWNDRFNKPLRAYLANSAVWSIAVQPDVHEDLIERALDEGVRGILVEKPVCQDLDRMESLVERAEEQDIITGVDYIELVHPVYEAILRHAVQDDFTPGRGFHWRSKDLRYQVGEGQRFENGIPNVKDGLGHDVAEVYGLYRALATAEAEAEAHYKKYDDGDIEPPEPDLELAGVDEFELWKDVEYRQGYPFRDLDQDSRAQFRVRGPDGAEFTIRGGYDYDDERRFFFWVDEEEKTAYYGNTLQRNFTTPAAYKIVGEEAVKQAEKELKSGNVVTKSDETDLMHEVGARPLSFSKTAYSERVSRMCRRVFSNDTPCTLRDALNIERVLADVYEEAGYPDAAHY